MPPPPPSSQLLLVALELDQPTSFLGKEMAVTAWCKQISTLSPPKIMRRMGWVCWLREKSNGWRESTCLGLTAGQWRSCGPSDLNDSRLGEECNGRFFLLLKFLRDKQKWQSMLQPAALIHAWEACFWESNKDLASVMSILLPLIGTNNTENC